MTQNRAKGSGPASGNSNAGRVTVMTLLHICVVTAAIGVFGFLNFPGTTPMAAPAAETVVTPEYKVKVAFLYNFAKLCDWPAAAFTSDRSAITIGVLGEDPFGNLLEETVRGHAIDGRPITIARYQKVEDVRGCHLLFISRSVAPQLKEIFAKLEGQSILTVGETEDFLKPGGVIRLFNDGEMVRFEVSLSAARRAHLQLSAKLLRLARSRDTKCAQKEP